MSFLCASLCSQFDIIYFALVWGHLKFFIFKLFYGYLKIITFELVLNQFRLCPFKNTLKTKLRWNLNLSHLKNLNTFSVLTLFLSCFLCCHLQTIRNSLFLNKFEITSYFVPFQQRLQWSWSKFSMIQSETIKNIRMLKSIGTFSIF